jgi:hypothetical protein
MSFGKARAAAREAMEYTRRSETNGEALYQLADALDEMAGAMASLEARLVAAGVIPPEPEPPGAYGGGGSRSY